MNKRELKKLSNLLVKYRSLASDCFCLYKEFKDDIYYRLYISFIDVINDLERLEL